MCRGQRFITHIENLADTFLQEYNDGHEALDAIKQLMDREPKWKRRIRLYMEINDIYSLHSLRKNIGNWYKEIHSQQEAVWDMYFPNEEENNDDMEDFLTDEDRF